MNPHALLLVIGSAGLHATWNFLAKRARDQVSFMFLMIAATPVVWLVPLIWMVWHGYSFGPLYIPLLGGFVQAVYCLLMGKGYACGDLSHVYPLARGVAPALIAVIAWPLFHQPLTPIGIAGLVAVLLGSLVINTENGADLLNGQSLRAMCRPASRLALMAAVTIAFYHLLDKAGASASSPFAYLCAMHASLIVFLWVFTRTQRTHAEIMVEWRRNWKSAFAVAVLSFGGYFLVVSAMNLPHSPVAYVVSLRNLSILIGVLLGVTALREQGRFWRITGAACMVSGILAIALGG